MKRIDFFQKLEDYDTIDCIANYVASHATNLSDSTFTEFLTDFYKYLGEELPDNVTYDEYVRRYHLGG